MIRSTITEIYDMNTHIGELGIIGLHTPRFDLLFKHLFGHFVQFKRWKYDGATFSLIPAAQLPQDVAGVSLGAGDQAVDPRDVFNPILHKGYTGESLGSFLDENLEPNLYRGDSLDYSFVSGNAPTGSKPTAEVAYYQMLTQGNFKKMMPMGSIQNKYVYPMVYDLATTRQLTGSWRKSVTQGTDHLLGEPVTEVNDFYTLNADTTAIEPSMQSHAGDITVGADGYIPYSSDHSTLYQMDVPFLTPRKRKLGWMDTLQKVLPAESNDSTMTLNANSEPFTFSQLPKLMEYVLVTPPSYYTKLYYRLVIKHHVSFAGQRSAQGASTALSSSFANYWNFMEQLPSTTGDGSTSVVSVDALGADITPVVDGGAF